MKKLKAEKEAKLKAELLAKKKAEAEKKMKEAAAAKAKALAQKEAHEKKVAEAKANAIAMKKKKHHHKHHHSEDLIEVNADDFDGAGQLQRFVDHAGDEADKYDKADRFNRSPKPNSFVELDDMNAEEYDG